MCPQNIDIDVTYVAFFCPKTFFFSYNSKKTIIFDSCRYHALIGVYKINRNLSCNTILSHNTQLQTHKWDFWHFFLLIFLLEFFSFKSFEKCTIKGSSENSFYWWENFILNYLIYQHINSQKDAFFFGVKYFYGNTCNIPYLIISFEFQKMINFIEFCFIFPPILFILKSV